MNWNSWTMPWRRREFSTRRSLPKKRRFWKNSTPLPVVPCVRMIVDAGVLDRRGTRTKRSVDGCDAESPPSDQDRVERCLRS